MAASGSAKPTFAISFQPMGITVDVPKGETLLQAAAKVGVEVDTVCGGNGLCGKCSVIVVDADVVPAKPTDRIHLNDDEIQAGYRLSCQIEATRDLSVEIPAAMSRSVQVLERGAQRDVALRPNVFKIHIPYTSPLSRDGTADWEAVKSVLPRWFEKVDIPLHWLRKLPTLIRDKAGMTLTVVGRRQVTRVESGDATQINYGIAVDVGTTSVVAYLVDLKTGAELGVASGVNKQAAYGDDVVGRLTAAQFDEAGLVRLHEIVIDQLNDVFQSLLKGVGAEAGFVSEVSIVGNVAMQHFLLGLDSTYLGLFPYAPVTRDSMVVTAEEIGIDLGPDTPVYVLPNIAGFVGSDTVGVMLASGMASSSDVMMAVDLGTNGEVALGSKDRLIACSAPAGPAFEGARIKQGMRATAGAIDHVAMEGDVSFSVIGGAAPVGICGSALIDIAAAMLQAGLVDYTGKLLRSDELSVDVSPALRDRLIPGKTRKDSAFLLVRQGEGGAPADIVFTQQDVREFQLAKGAIRAGEIVLQSHLGVSDDQLVEVVLAGAFGTHIDLENARRVDLVPQLGLDRLRSVGNAAGVGAKLTLISTKERMMAERIAKSTEHVRLSGLDDFQRAFTHALGFPDDDSHRVE